MTQKSGAFFSLPEKFRHDLANNTSEISTHLSEFSCLFDVFCCTRRKFVQKKEKI